MQKRLINYLREEKFYKDVVEDGSDVIFVVDFNLKILYHNPSLKQTVGYDDLVNQDFLEYIHPRNKQHVKEAFEICKAHPYNSNVEFKFLCGDDTYKYLEFNSINLKFKDGIEGMILDCRDVSERKRDQEELINAQKAKEQFLANMSHEIRTPINGIVGMVNLLLESAAASEQKKHLNAIKHSTDNLKVIINDILDFSVIESGKLSFERIGFNIVYQTNTVIDSLALQAEEKGLKIELKTDDSLDNLVVIGDPVRLNQVLINLINNAIKFTMTGAITVEINSSRALDGKVKVTFKVIDTGIGIEKDKVKSIFETFKQADESITRKFGGTGLGLTISKQLVELQGGKISVESMVGKGTIFTFVIPYEVGSKDDILQKEKSQELNFEKRKEARRLKGMDILLVEDNDINRMYASTILKKWGCNIKEAENGQVALEKLRKNKFDAILMDIHMPILDGIEASRTIRTTFDKPKSQTPIVAFTANALKGDKDKYLEAGMNDYISKPFMPEELFNILIKYYNEPEENPAKSAEAGLTNLSYLKKMSNNDEKFVKDLIDSFITNTPEILADIERAKTEDNWNEVGTLAHKLKPNLAFMGIDSLKGLVLQIEHSGKKGENLKQLPSNVEQLVSKVRAAIEELKRI